MSPLGGLSPRDGLLPTHCSASFASGLGRRGTLLRRGGEEVRLPKYICGFQQRKTQSKGVVRNLAIGNQLAKERSDLIRAAKMDSMGCVCDDFELRVGNVFN